DRRVGKEKENGRPLRAAAILTTDDATAEKALQQLGKAEAITNVVLAIDRPGGPPGYGLSMEAEMTVILYDKYEVRANHAFAKGMFTERARNAIFDDIPKITRRYQGRRE